MITVKKVVAVVSLLFFIQVSAQSQIAGRVDSTTVSRKDSGSVVSKSKDPTILEKILTPEWLISVGLTSFILNILANYATRWIAKGFLQSVTIFNGLRQKIREKEAEVEKAKDNTALELSRYPQDQWLALLISLRSEVRTVLLAIAPIFLTLVIFRYIQDNKIVALVLIPLVNVCTLAMTIESKKAIHWAQILRKSIDISKERKGNLPNEIQHRSKKALANNKSAGIDSDKGSRQGSKPS